MASPLLELAPDLYTAQDYLRLPGGVQLPIRMTVVRLPGGGLVLHSPLAPSDALVAAVTALGPVAHVIAPNRMHTLYPGVWRERFPSATLHGAPGMREDRPTLPWAAPLGEFPGPWRDVLDELPIAGAPRLNEVAFFHRPSRTLIVTDLFFNVVGPRNLRTRLALSFTGTNGRFAFSRAWRFFGKDRLALATSLDAALRRDFVRLVPAHGEVLTDPALPARARAVAAWALAPLARAPGTTAA